MGDKDEWKNLAFESQYHYYETLGSRAYDEVEKTNLFLLKKKVGFATCGKPCELPNCSNYNTGYKKEDLVSIKSICDKIIEKSEHDPIRFACTVLILYHKGSVFETPVFRIVGSTGNIFIDAHSRVYQNWNMFLENNKLPDCEFCYPLNGEYNSVDGMLVGFAYSPASGMMNKAVDCLDTAGSVASVAAASVFAAGLFITVTPVVASVAGATVACTGVYSLSRSVGSLYDRSKHEQSIGLKDQESRSAWMSIGSSAVGMATLAALRGAQKVVESGKSLSKLSVFGLHALTASSAVFSGFGFVESLVVCADKYNKGKLSKKDIFDISCELLFLFNAIASAKATTQLVNNMSSVVSETPSAQRKLTKTQKRNLRKRAAKRRAKGLSPYVKEESNLSSNSGFSTTLQLILFEAVKAYAPRLEEIIYTCQSIGHDIVCWKLQEIPDLVLMKNLARNLIRLYNDYKDEVSQVIIKVIKYFSSLSSDKIMQNIYKLFEKSSDEIRSIFCTKLINVEDEIDSLISEAEQDITDLHERLRVESDISSNVSELQDFDNSDDNDLNPESQHFLDGCRDVVASSSWSCSDLQDFGDIMDGVKYVVVSEFKFKISNYKKSLETAMSASGNSFDINKFHQSLGIQGDIGQHMFNETLNNLTASNIIYKIKTKYSLIKKERNPRTVPVWESLTEGVFHYYGPHGSGDLSTSDLLSVVSSAVNISLTEQNCQILSDRDVVMIEVNDRKEKIVIYCGVTEENTASGVIVVIKLKE